MEHTLIYIIPAVILCFMMTWGVGANDLANVMSTTMGSQAITIRQAIVIAIIFEIAGAFFGGTGVTETIRDRIINISQLSDSPLILIEGMLGVLLACTIWMNLASYLGVPVSITNALVGSMVGFGSVVLGNNYIHWNQVSHIAIGWITSPLIAGVSSYALFISIQQTIFAKANPLAKAKLYMPLYLFLIGCILSFFILFKGLKHFNIHLSNLHSILTMLSTSIIIVIIGTITIRRIPEKQIMKRRDNFRQIERYFAILMAMTACAMVFAHGSNDVALTVGPLTIIYTLVLDSHQHFNVSLYPSWIILLALFGVISGFLLYGRKVIETVGSSITTLTPSRAFAATLAAATTVVVATSLGIPVSATQTLVGAVLGVGLAR
ncbi:MAG: phosphate permease, partial [Legionellales bacterium RIFCSPHIGHO2_12_FULL_35_11]